MSSMALRSRGGHGLAGDLCVSFDMVQMESLSLPQVSVAEPLRACTQPDRCSQNPETSSTRGWRTRSRQILLTTQIFLLFVWKIYLQFRQDAAQTCTLLGPLSGLYFTVFILPLSDPQRYWDRMSASVLLNKVNVSILPVGSFRSGRGFVTGPYISP